jgi:D-beta-D-heptose 7-phosphate kinase/D-beta-D-heptose 1-phosphate adenosyltransferase
MDNTQAQALIAGFNGKRIAVIGDLILDRYIWGTATRISPEAPVPIVHARRTSSTPGGAANVLHNLSSLGCTAVAFGAVGEDSAGGELEALLKGAGIELQGLLRDAGRCTIEKTRIIAGNQQVVRVDHEDVSPHPQTLAAELLDRLRRELDENALAAIIVEDYAKGLVNCDLLDGVLKLAHAADIPVALDPHPRNPFEIEGLDVITPNRKEAFQLAGMIDPGRILPVMEDTAIMEAAQKLWARWKPGCLLITLGGDGILLFQEGREPHHIPTMAREVFDVSGAGDTVIATFVAAIAAGATREEASILSNHAAGIVVGKVGAVAIDPAELVQSF